VAISVPRAPAVACEPLHGRIVVVRAARSRRDAQKVGRAPSQAASTRPAESLGASTDANRGTSGDRHHMLPIDSTVPVAPDNLGHLFFALTRRALFAHETTQATPQTHLHEPASAASTLRSDVPRAVDAVIVRPMARRPATGSRRPASSAAPRSPPAAPAASGTPGRGAVAVT
jgi:hypothetical protein